MSPVLWTARVNRAHDPSPDVAESRFRQGTPLAPVSLPVPLPSTLPHARYRQASPSPSLPAQGNAVGDAGGATTGPLPSASFPPLPLPLLGGNALQSLPDNSLAPGLHAHVRDTAPSPVIFGAAVNANHDAAAVAPATPINLAPASAHRIQSSHIGAVAHSGHRPTASMPAPDSVFRYSGASQFSTAPDGVVGNNGRIPAAALPRTVSRGASACVSDDGWSASVNADFMALVDGWVAAPAFAWCSVLKDAPTILQNDPRWLPHCNGPPTARHSCALCGVRARRRVPPIVDVPRKPADGCNTAMIQVRRSLAGGAAEGSGVWCVVCGVWCRWCVCWVLGVV